MEALLYFGPPIEAVQVNSSNLAEVAEWCGGKVAAWESKDEAGKFYNYVWVPTPRGTKISWAYPGMYVVKRKATNSKGSVKTTLAVFHKEYFEKNFFENPVVAATAVQAPVAVGRVGPGST